MPFRIIRDDITKVEADVIVNTANPYPMIGRGTDSAVYAAAGVEALLAERRKIGEIEPGGAAATPAFALKARYIIHTVGPSWEGGESGERGILSACYRNTLALAAELKAESIAFPLIATGIYGFPKDEALSIALSEINRFLLAHEMDVILAVFDRKSFELSGRLAGKIDEYIDEHSVGIRRESEYGDVWPDRLQGRGGAAGNGYSAAFPEAEGKSLDEVLGSAGETFQQRLLRLIRESGMDDVTVYKKANIDRKVFSSIRRNVNYRPKKRTAVAFAIALELDMPAMLDLLSRAEIAMSPSSRFDLIIRYCVTHGIYDIFEINAALFQYAQPLLGTEE